MPPHLAALFKIPEVLFSSLLFHAYNDLVVEEKRQEIHEDYYLRGFREKQTIFVQLQ